MAVDLMRVKLMGKAEVAEGTMSFYFDRPRGFDFIPGQHMEVILANGSGRDAKHHFTISSAPFQQDLMITTRMRDSAYKRALGALPPESGVQIERAKGEFVLHRDAARPAVFLIGGIGITAPRSILLQAVHEGLQHRIIHFYSDDRPEEAAFLEELRQIADANPNYTLVATMTNAEKSAQEWKGETRRLGMDLLTDHLEDIAAPIYYASGPPKMVQAMKAMLDDAGIAADAIRTEEYTGY